MRKNKLALEKNIDLEKEIEELISSTKNLEDLFKLDTKLSISKNLKEKILSIEKLTKNKELKIWKQSFSKKIANEKTRILCLLIHDKTTESSEFFISIIECYSKASHEIFITTKNKKINTIEIIKDCTTSMSNQIKSARFLVLLERAINEISKKESITIQNTINNYKTEIIDLTIDFAKQYVSKDFEEISKKYNKDIDKFVESYLLKILF